MSTYISIGIFDDHPVLASGLRSMLEAHSLLKISLVEHTRDGLINALQQCPLDVLIMDVVAPDVEGLELFKEVHQKFPGIAVLAYSTLKSPVLVENLLAIGVQGYVNKRQPASELLDALNAIVSGNTWVPEQYRHLTVRSGTTPTTLVELSAREKEIIRLIVDGKLSKEIANELGISQKTVENHRHRLFRKLEVNNVAELLKKVLSLGYSLD